MLPNIKAQNVIVMDNAAYHSVKLHSAPSSSSMEKCVQDWLTRHGTTWDSTMNKTELLHLVNIKKVVQPELEKCHVDAIAEKNGRMVLRLPPYH